MKSEEKNKEKEKISLKSVIDSTLDMVESVIFSIFVVLLIFTYVLRISDVSGKSMEPTLHNEDRVIISPLFYKPKQNDIIIVDSDVLNKLLVKRVVAVGGQTVKIDFKSGIVYVDGVAMDEQLYVEEPDGSKPELKADHFVNTLTTDSTACVIGEYSSLEGDIYTVMVPEEHIFVLGDNRNVSKDSKQLGPVHEDEIMGKVVMRIHPFIDFGFLN